MTAIHARPRRHTAGADMSDDHEIVEVVLNETPGHRAELDIKRERASLQVKVAAGLVKGEVAVTADGPGGFATGNAITLLLLVVAASVPAMLATIVLLLSHVHGPALAIAALAIFAFMFAVCILLAVHWPQPGGRAPAPAPVVIAAPVVTPYGPRRQKSAHPGGASEGIRSRG